MQNTRTRVALTVLLSTASTRPDGRGGSGCNNWHRLRQRTCRDLRKIQNDIIGIDE